MLCLLNAWLGSGVMQYFFGFDTDLTLCLISNNNPIIIPFALTYASVVGAKGGSME